MSQKRFETEMRFHVETPTVEVRFDLTSTLPPAGIFSWKLGGVAPFAKSSQFLYPLTYLFPEMIQIFNHQNKPKPAADIRSFNPIRAISSSNKLSSQELLDGFDFHVLSTLDGPVVAWRPSEATDRSEWITAVVDYHDLEKVSKELCRFYADVTATNGE